MSVLVTGSCCRVPCRCHRRWARVRVRQVNVVAAAVAGTAVAVVAAVAAAAVAGTAIAVAAAVVEAEAAAAAAIVEAAAVLEHSSCRRISSCSSMVLQ